MQNTVTICKVSMTEWQQYKKLRLHALQENPQTFISTYEQESQFTDQEWQEKLQKYVKEYEATMFVIKDQNELVGMAGAYWDSQEDVVPTAHIFSVYIHEHYRGKGLGKQLMQTLLQYVKTNTTVQIIQLYVNTTPLSVVHLYQRLGFQKVRDDIRQMGDGQKHQKYVMEMHV